MQTTNHKYNPQIDSLRALAVVSVIIFHLSSGLLPGGFSGVDVFFVISGYVVSGSLSNNAQKKFSSFITTFYAKRLIRILPALLVCLFFVSLVTSLFIPKSWLGGSTSYTIILAFFGLSNFSLMQSGDSYFAPRSDFNPATHTWSLGVEEQFYFVLPLVYFLWARYSNKGNLSRVAKYALPLLAVLSFCYSIYASSYRPSQAYYSLLSRFWELALGVLLFQWHYVGVKSSVARQHDGLLCAVGLTLILCGVVFADKSAFPIPWALLPTVGTLLYIDAVVRTRSVRNRFISLCGRWPFPLIGKVSYSLYLWHWPVFVLFRWTVGLEHVGLQVIAIILVIVLSVLSYKIVELPARHSRHIHGLSRGAVVAICLSLVAFISASSATVLILQPYLSRSVTKNKDVWLSDVWRSEPRVGDGCSPVRSDESLGNGFIVRFEHLQCSNKLRKPNLFVIGDSHATALTRLVSRFATSNGGNAYIYSKLGCGFLSIGFPMSDECATFYSLATAELRRQVEPGDIVLLSSLRLRRLGDQWGRFDEGVVEEKTFGPSSQIERSAGVQEARSWIRSMDDKDVQIAFLAPTPIFRAPPFRCSDWFNRMNPICSGGLVIDRTTLQRFRTPVVLEMLKLTDEFNNVRIWDPFDLLCPGEVCRSSDSDQTLFFDGDHLSGYGNDFIYESFVNFALR